MRTLTKTAAFTAGILAFFMGRLRGPISLFGAAYTAFGSNLFANSWTNPGPWRTTSGIVAGWIVYEICTIARQAVEYVTDKIQEDLGLID